MNLRKQQRKEYIMQGNYKPCVILALGNWKWMSCVSLQFWSRYLPIFLLLCKEAPPSPPLPQLFLRKVAYVGLILIRIPLPTRENEAQRSQISQERSLVRVSKEREGPRVKRRTERKKKVAHGVFGEGQGAPFDQKNVLEVKQ